MLNELLLKNQQRINTHRQPHTPSGMAFSNPEYMCFSELNTLLKQNHLSASKTANPVAVRRNHRPVPLPPPSRPPPPPPTSLPPALPPKLYQNLPIVSEQIHVDCYNPRQHFNFNRPSSNLLRIDDYSSTSLNQTDSTYSSMIILQSCSNTASDSSTATMIIRNSPPDQMAAHKPQLPVRSAPALLSPIMTSSRADLHRQQHQTLKSIFGTLNESMPAGERPEEASSSSRDNEDDFFRNVTRSLPSKRLGNHQRQRRLSFSDTLEILAEQHLTTGECSNTTSHTLTQKSFSNFNYDMYLRRQHGSFTPSTSSLSASSSMSSMVLQFERTQKYLKGKDISYWWD